MHEYFMAAMEVSYLAGCDNFDPFAREKLL